MPAEFRKSELPPVSLNEEIIYYKTHNACWYGHIFRHRKDAETDQTYSLWHDPNEQIIKVWSRWKLVRRL